MPQQQTRYRWYQNVRRYRARNGRFISQDTITKHIHETTEAFKASVLARTLSLTEDFSFEKFNDWATTLRAEIRAMHNAVTMIALGGKEATTKLSGSNAEIWRQAEVEMNRQTAFFDRFMLQAVSGAIKFDGAFVNRAGMYADAGYTTYQNMVRMREFEGGMNQERRTLGFVLTNHCDDCSALSDLNWQPMGSLPQIGDSQCGSRCKCSFEFRKI